MKDIFGDLFDFNRNSKVEPTEQAMEFALLQTIDEEKNDEFSVDELNDFDIIFDDW